MEYWRLSRLSQPMWPHSSALALQIVCLNLILRLHLGIPSARSFHLQALFLMKVLVKTVFPLNQQMMSDLIILIISKPLLQIQNYCNTHYQVMVTWTNHTKFLWKPSMKWGFNYLQKILSLLLIKMVAPSILILRRYMWETCVYCMMMWDFTNGVMKTNLHVFGTVRIFITLKFSSYPSKMQ